MIRVERVTKRFEGRNQVTALRDVTLRIEPGEMVAVVGPSGSGKSTLLNLIGGLDRPSEGEVLIDGEPLSALPDDALTRVRRDKVGFVFQAFNLLATLSCLDNVALPLHLKGWRRKLAVARATELLSLVGLSDRLMHRPEELSGGQRQRVAIARALATQPSVLLADEPTGNLDTATGADVLALLSDLRQTTGCTVLIVTHDELVAKHCDRTITVRDGRVVEDSHYRALRPVARAMS